MKTFEGQLLSLLRRIVLSNRHDKEYSCLVAHCDACVAKKEALKILKIANDDAHGWRSRHKAKCKCGELVNTLVDHACKKGG